ncbi:MAG: hypothetical protein OXB96_00305 [Candidatus Kaiserbacteria bacterium]|nr:hypothetical protein [Candidatus Kaiserbacteria bacterium]
MQKQKQTTSKVSYILTALILATYILFPAWYRAISQKLFSTIYTQHAQVSQGRVPAASDRAVTNPDLLPISVIVRPPQTPYDYVITTTPEQYQQTAHEEGVRYVYDTATRPVGFVEKAYPSLLIVSLFSAPGGNEKFSVNGYVTRGRGEGGGSFSLQVPIDMAVTVGAPIVHQATGKVVSTAVSIKRIPEKNVQQVIGVLGSSPLQMATLYIPRKQNTAPSRKTLDSAIEAAHSRAEDAQQEQEKQEEQGTNKTPEQHATPPQATPEEQGSE